MDRSWQIVTIYVLTHLALIFFLYPANIIDSTDEAHWIPVTIGVIVHILIVYLYLNGLSRFPGKNIISIYSDAGKLFTILLLVPLFLYFLMVNIITLRAYSEVITIVFLSKTPIWAVMGLLLCISSYLAFHGVFTIFRTAMIISILFLPLVLFVLLSSFQNADWHYVFPIWSSDFSFLKEDTYIKSFFAIGGGYLFLGFIGPYCSYKINKVYLAIALIIPCLFLSVYIPILTFGQATASTFLFPFVVVLDAINITWLMFDRTTIFFLLSMITFIMLFLAFILWKTVQITHSFVPVLKERTLTIFISIFIYIICLFIPNWKDVNELFLWNSFLRFYVLITVPLSIFLLGILSRKKVKTYG